MNIYTSKDMQEIDRISIEEKRIPSIVLMENAAKTVVKEILSNFPLEAIRNCLIIAGKGNNGGDGIAVGRILRNLGFRPSIFVLCDRNELSQDATIQAERYSILGEILFSSHKDFYFELETKLKSCSLVIDALLGTGTRGKVSEKYERIIDLINNSSNYVVSIDIPSGLSGDSFVPPGKAIKASLTVTLGALKLPLVSPECEEFCGKVVVTDIGLSEESFRRIKPLVETIDIDVARKFFPERDNFVHKGKLGHIFIIAGGRGKLGAAILSARGALRAGSGLVTVGIPESLANFVTIAIPEAMTLPLSETEEGTLSLKSLEPIMAFSEKVDSVSLGPGLSTHSETSELVRRLYKELKVPSVFDADGINAFESVSSDLDKFESERIFTPHPGEFGRLLNMTPKEVLKDRYSIAQSFSRKNKIVTVLKGYKTIISNSDGFLRINTTGGGYMAGPGMGDVLTGIIGALLAKKLTPFDAASAAVFWHGLSAQLVFEKKGYGIVASEVADFLPIAESCIRKCLLK